MNKRIVSIIINWLGLACIEARLNEMDYLEIIRMREQAKRIDAVDARLTVCEQKIDLAAKAESAIEEAVDNATLSVRF